MPLSKARDKARKRLERARVVQPKPLYPVQPSDMKSRLAEQGIGLDGNRIRLDKATVQPTIPIYNPNKQYAPGDKVMVKPMYGKSKKLVEVTIPSIDADGNFIPDY